MKLTHIYKIQKGLKDRIGYNKFDRYEKMLLALNVELGECAQEWRGFKFWSKDQEQRAESMLEEYVDVLHFTLELAFEFHNDLTEMNYQPKIGRTIASQFNDIFGVISDLSKKKAAWHYMDLMDSVLGLGKMLDFSWDQIEEAYFKKNEINHVRQDQGY